MIRDTFAKVSLVSGLRETHLTGEHCGSVRRSHGGFEVICFGEPDRTGLNSTPLKALKPPYQVPGRKKGSFARSEAAAAKFFAAQFWRSFT